jgi:monovalent cation/hydrogen antiporter
MPAGVHSSPAFAPIKANATTATAAVSPRVVDFAERKFATVVADPCRFVTAVGASLFHDSQSPVDSPEILIPSLLVAVAALSAAAGWLGIPYPILLVLGGLVLGVAPAVPDVELEPDLVLLGVLPPLLYSAAFFGDLRTMRNYARALSLTSIGLVLLTTVAVAVVAHEMIDELSWAAAFALGAIVSPTDPIAATAIMRRLGAPRQVVNFVEGESLVNDASALVAYRVAVAAAVGGSFSLLDATAEFVFAGLGGVAVGLAVGWLSVQVRRRLEDPPVEIAVSLFTAYAAFLPADELGLSGILAAVAAGLYVGWHAPTIASPEVRLQGFGFWEILTFLLNAGLFVLIGLQIGPILDELSGESLAEAAGYAAVISVIVIATRFLWAFTTPYLLRAIDRRPSQRERRVGARERVVVAWSGMRGGVSLAAALAIPLETDAGAAFPGRDLILLITFGVILITVVGQGLTLPALIRRLDVHDPGDEEREEVRARIEAAQAALDRLEELADADWVGPETMDRVGRLYDYRRRRFAARTEEVEDDGFEDRAVAYQRLMHDIYDAQRQVLIRLRNEGQISNDVMHRIERELDLEESRLEI